MPASTQPATEPSEGTRMTGWRPCIRSNHSERLRRDRAARPRASERRLAATSWTGCNWPRSQPVRPESVRHPAIRGGPPHPGPGFGARRDDDLGADAVGQRRAARRWHQLFGLGKATIGRDRSGAELACDSVRVRRAGQIRRAQRQLAADTVHDNKGYAYNLRGTAHGGNLHRPRLR